MRGETPIRRNVSPAVSVRARHGRLASSSAGLENRPASRLALSRVEAARAAEAHWNSPPVARSLRALRSHGHTRSRNAPCSRATSRRSSDAFVRIGSSWRRQRPERLSCLSSVSTISPSTRRLSRHSNSPCSGADMCSSTSRTASSSTRRASACCFALEETASDGGVFAVVLPSGTATARIARVMRFDAMFLLCETLEEARALTLPTLDASKQPLGSRAAAGP